MNKEEIKIKEFVPTPENPCEIQTKNIVGKNLLEGKYFDGNGIPKMIGITKNEFLEYRQLQQENKVLRENAENNDRVVDKTNWENQLLKKENKQLKDKLSKIETLIINHNCDTGDIYYKYNSRFLKSELKQRILEILEDKEV